LKNWYALEIEIARVAETAATTQLWAGGTTGIEYSEDPSSDLITLRAYFDLAPDMEKIRAGIVHSLQLMGLPETAFLGITGRIVADQDWLAEWKKGYQPLEIAERLLITPSWKIEQVKDSGRIVIQIDPGMAFGTGTHETTRGCLEMLEKFWRGGKLLDAGTGTGILAIAAIRLAPGSCVVGFDIDPEAVTVAEENARVNGVADEVVIEVNKIAFYHGWEFDLVVANLTADVITQLTSDFAQITKPLGLLVVSGILREQADKVLSVLSQAMFEPVDSSIDGEWFTAALRFHALR
jgi:ribosomal protein L11 methyltransferase